MADNQPAIVLAGVGKRYTLYPTRADGLLDAFGLAFLFPKRRARFQTFWALRGINLALPKGARVGVVGRNGAGKSTLLKLITQNVSATEGTVDVRGEVQALLQTGSGMHPDFTGYQNIEAALTYQGLGPDAIRAAVADIEEFTELGPFLTQPFKSYSTGMQARLAFAAATMVKPDILIVDEVLGVGDGYFLAKSTERMQRLIDGGATVLLVSHSMEQVVRFTDQAVWLDRGQIVAHGDSLDVVKEYERYLRLLDERRLRARNRSAQAGGAVPDADPFVDELRLRVTAPAGGEVRVASVTLAENDRPQETVRVGGPQDGSAGNAAGVVLEAGAGWSDPVAAGQPYRRLTDGATGDVLFRLYHFDSSVSYRFDGVAQAVGGAATMALVRQGVALATASLDPSADWRAVRLAVEGSAGSPVASAAPDVRLHHWGGIGGLEIGRVRMRNEAGDEAVVFPFGGTLVVEVDFRATQPGTYPLRLLMTLYRRSDGLKVSQQIGRETTLTLAQGEHRTARLRLEPINLGNDTYVFSVGLFKVFDAAMVDAPERYDLTERSYEFRVFGREPQFNSVFQHPGTWEVLD